MPERLFTTHQVGDLLGSTPGEVLQWIRKGWLPCQRLPNGPIRISERGLVEFLKGRGVDIEKLMIDAALRGALPDEPVDEEPPARLEIEADEHRPAETDESSQPVNDEERALLHSSAAPPDEQAPSGPEDEGEEAEEVAAEAPASAGRPPRQEEVVAEATSPLERINTPRLRRLSDRERAEAAEAALAKAKAEAPGETAPTASLGGGPAPRPPERRQSPFDESLPDLNELLQAEALLGAGESAARGEPEWPWRPEPPGLEEAPDEPHIPEAADEQAAPPEGEPEPGMEFAPSDDAEEAAVADTVEQAFEALLADALDHGASHLHLEPRADGLMLRLRIDGVLHDRPGFAERLKEGLAPAVAEHLASLAGLGRAGAARPQAGAFAWTIDERRVEVAVSAFPTVHGRRLVVRIAERDVPAAGLGERGISGRQQERLESIVASDGGGLVVVAGLPRGGVGETLRALAGPLCEAGRDVLTIETPARAELAGACRWPIDPFGACRFADAARGMVDQDADVVLIDRVGEPVTAVAALAAAMDGAMVLAGVRAGGVGEALGLLAEMGLEPWPLAGALRAVVVLRTVRRLCGSCRQPLDRPVDLPDQLGLDAGRADLTIYAPAGCSRCGQSGYFGVLSLASVLVPDGEVVGLVRRGAEAVEIDAAARRAGAGSLAEAAGEALRAGWTSLEEVRRVL